MNNENRETEANLSEELAMLIWNPNEISDRAAMFVETSILKDLDLILPAKTEVSAHDYQILEKLLTKIRNEVEMLRERLRKPFGNREIDQHEISQNICHQVNASRNEILSSLREVLGEKSILEQQIATASLPNLAKQFELEEISDDQLLELFESAPSNRKLTADDFVQIKEAIKISTALGFDSTPLQNMSSYFIEEASSDLEKIPTLQTRWNSTELFADVKMPSTVIFTHTPEERERIWQEAEEALIGGFYEWKQRCRIEQKGETFVGPNGEKLEIDDALNVLEREFKQQLDQRKNMALEVFNNRPWEATFKMVQEKVRENLETFCQLQDASEPEFIGEALQLFFDRASKGTQVAYLGVESQFVDKDMRWYSDKKYVSSSRGASRFSVNSIIQSNSPTGNDLHRKAIAKIMSKTDLSQKDTQAMQTAARQLEEKILIELYESLPEEFESRNKVDKIRTWKQILGRSFEAIASFYTGKIPLSLLIELKNTTGLLIAQQARDYAERDAVIYEYQEQDDSEVAQELQDFHAEIGVEPYQASELFALEFKRRGILQSWWNELIKITKSRIQTDSLKLDPRLNQKLAFRLNEIFEKLRAKNISSELQQYSDLVSLNRKFHDAIDEIPAVMALDDALVSMPAELKEFMQQEVSVMLMALSQKIEIEWEIDEEADTATLLDWQDAADVIRIVQPQLCDCPAEVREKIQLAQVGSHICVLVNQKDAEELNTIFSELSSVHSNRLLRIRSAIGINQSTNMKAYTLPTIEELAKMLLEAEQTDGKFLHEPVEHEERKVHNTNSGAERPAEERKPIPRLKTLRDLLLKNRLKASFTWDKSELEEIDISLFDTVEKGHYVIVTLPEVGMQIAISDDYNKPSFIVYNKIEIDEYKMINTKMLKEEYGGTLVRWGTPEQWTKSIENTVQEQKENPRRIYPMNCRYPTPLDSFPNEEAIHTLRKDLLAAASIIQKDDRPWELGTGDFGAIKSGDILWSYGGNACGSAYLDRMRREFKMECEDVPRHAFQKQILKLLLWEVFPEYRKLKEFEDREKAEAMVIED